MSDIDDLRATAEDLIDDASRLQQIEEAKMRLRPGDPRLVELADEVERLIRQMQPKARAEKEIASQSDA